MSRWKLKWGVAIAVTVALALLIIAGCKTPRTAPPATTTSAAATETFKPLAPGPNDARIAYLTAQFLQNRQYSLQLLDTSMSKKFFDNYLGTLDPSREYFIQSDIDEFAHYRTNLDLLTLGGHGKADLTPAYQIFARFLKRLALRTDYVERLLKQDHFNFDSDEQMATDRRHAPYPKDLAAAEVLWRQQLRYEFLQARLDREFSKTNGGTLIPLPASADTDITTDLARRYNWILHTATNWDSDDILQYYLNALTHAYDPHSDYLNAPHEQNFKIEMSLSLGGIGAQLGEDYGYCTVASLIPGGPADKCKQIKVNDRIIAVAQTNQPPVNVVDMDLNKVVELIRGPKGTQVRLTLAPAENRAATNVVALIRDEVKLESQEAKAKLIELPAAQGGAIRIGVINVPSFYAPIGSDAHSYISADVAKLIKKLEAERVAGIILDMRGNPGGSLEEAIQFTGLFIKSGPVVLARNAEGEVETDVVSNPAALYSGPLVVLVNRGSASAAEIAAAALQDYGRALIVGDISTHGKGTVQSLMPLDNLVWPATPSATNDPGTLKLTIRKFYRITGASTQLKGVVPDIILPDVLNYLTNIGETNLDNALPWDTLPASISDRIHYQKFNLVQPYLAELRRLSDARIATNRDFDYVRQDIAQYEKAQAEQSATLNEREAIQQREADDARALARDADWAARPLPAEKIYDLTVENAGLPGLPPPEALCTTNVDVVVTATNANGSVCFMTTNDTFGVGILLSQSSTNTPPGPAHSGAVVTRTGPAPVTHGRQGGYGGRMLDVRGQPQPDAMLDETEHILEDYVSLLSKNTNMIANQ